jgi:hypothetical protein
MAGDGQVDGIGLHGRPVFKGRDVVDGSPRLYIGRRCVARRDTIGAVVVALYEQVGLAENKPISHVAVI